MAGGGGGGIAVAEPLAVSPLAPATTATTMAAATAAVPPVRGGRKEVAIDAAAADMLKEEEEKKDWHLLTAKMTTARQGLGVAAVGTRLFAVGGWPGPLASAEWIDTAKPAATCSYEFIKNCNCFFFLFVKMLAFLI